MLSHTPPAGAAGSSVARCNAAGTVGTVRAAANGRGHARNLTRNPIRSGPFAAAALLALPGAAAGLEVNDWLSIGGLIAAGGQCQQVNARLPIAGNGDEYNGNDYGDGNENGNGNGNGNGLDDFSNPALLEHSGNICRGGLPVQLEVSLRPSAQDEFFFLVGFGVDNGLNPVSPFRLAPWAADLEADVKDINGRGRDYLLLAWYRHEFQLPAENALGATFGIINSADYLDDNAFAADEFTQFMNEAFVNAHSYDLPAYDAGAALELAAGAFSFHAVGMNVGENEDGNNFNFWGVQAGWHPEFALGAGNYRLVLTGTGKQFLDPAGEKKHNRLAWGLSFDQELGPVFGAFLRLAWQGEDAAVDYQALYSGGININGGPWQRPDDNIGLGYAYLDGGNTDVRRTNVFEGYYRAQVNEFLAVTANVQYMSDNLVRENLSQRDPEGWLLGLRLTAMF
ncbi:MAG: porin [Chromatiaceae bacterium]|nr:MAG: porin [Chromatiaceae bacterium]